MKKNRALFRCLLLALLMVTAASLNGCVFVPVIDGIKKLGVTKSDREKLLKPQVDRFVELVYWNKMQEAGVLIKPEVKSEKLRALNKAAKGYRLVDSKIEFIEFNDASDQATVDVVTRRFKVPFYVVEEFQEQQRWEFSVSNGWQFADSTVFSGQ